MEFNKVSKRATGIVAAMILIGWFALAARSGNVPQLGDFEIYAASMVESGKAEVRLRWIMKSGWLPEGGVNLYRNEAGGNAILLNPSILGANPGKIANIPWKVPATPKGNEGKTKDKLQYSYQDALQVVRSNQAKLPASPFLSQSGTRLDSAFSAKAFQGLKQLRGLQLNPPEVDPLSKPKPTQQMAAQSLANYKDLSDYQENLGYGNTTPVIQKVQKFDDESAAVMLRSNLLLGAMLHPNTIGNDLGLAFTDQTVVAGKKYHYVLKVVDKGDPTKQTLVAERDVIVQNGTPPSAPTGLQGFQYDATTVCLRWDRIEPSVNLGLVSYDLFRVDKNNPAGKKLNDMPVLIRDLPLAKKVGNFSRMEPMVLFHDTDAASAAPGEVTYQIVAVDMFGRKSPGASTKVNLEDLLTPPSVGYVAAEPSLKSGKVQVIWTAIDQPDVQYLVSRIDTESKKEDKLVHTSTGDLPTLSEYPELSATVNKTSIHRGTSINISPSTSTSTVKWLGFADTPPRDHYFLYKVTAVYKTHPRQSPPQFTKVIPVPSLTPPAAPIVQASFIPTDKLPPTPERVTGDKFAKVGKTKEETSNVFMRKRETHSIKPANLAGAVQLKWNTVPLAESYRIYRASGTGFKRASGDATVDAKNPIVQLGEQGKYHYRSEIPDSQLKDGQYSLVGEVDGKTEFYDYVSRSPAHIYWYHVVAVNRWGIPAAAATSQSWSKAVKVRVPGTVPPAAPILLAAAPDNAGNIQLVLAAPSSTDPAVNYHVYRGEASSQTRARTFIAIKDHKQILVDKGQRKGDEVILVDKLVQSGRTFEYYVIADNGEATPVLSPPSNKMRASTLKALVIAPTGVTAAKVGDEINVQWKGVANAAGYIVERSHSGLPSAEFAQVSDLLPGTSTSFVDRAPGPGPTYTYRVIAVDKQQNVSDPNSYPLDQQQKDPSKYPAQITITVKGP